MAILDNYGSGNQDGSSGLGGGGGGIYPSFAQSFDPGGSNRTLDSVEFYLSKTLFPTGNAVAKIYAHTGTYGTDSRPTGSALATSDNFDVSTLGMSMGVAEFIFSGANRITFDNAKHVAAVEYSGGDALNYVNVGYDESSPSHAGNLSILIGGTWTENFRDAIFAVKGTIAEPMKRSRMFFAVS